MGKRTTFDRDQPVITQRKKQKLEYGQVDTESTNLRSSYDLRQLLTFHQDASSVLRHSN